MRYAFDADVLIYAASPGHPLGEPVWALLDDPALDRDRVGSLLLLPELLIKPTRLGREDERTALHACLSRLELFPISAPVAALAVIFGADYGLRAADALHLATAVHAGAERFVTTNRRDFPRTITEVEVTYPDELPT